MRRVSGWMKSKHERCLIQTALMLAPVHGHGEAVRFLLDRNGDFHATVEYSLSAYMLAGTGELRGWFSTQAQTFGSKALVPLDSPARPPLIWLEKVDSTSTRGRYAVIATSQ
jgi:hypothetical protein